MAADIRTGGLFDKGKPVAFIKIPLFLECIITCVCMSLSVFHISFAQHELIISYIFCPTRTNCGLNINF